MIKLEIDHAQFILHQKKLLNIPHFSVQEKDYWVIAGGNGSGKTAFASALQGKLPLSAGNYKNRFRHIAMLSFEKQQAILQKTFNDRNNDGVSPDDFGESAREIILNHAAKPDLCDYYAARLNITTLLARPFILLSTGESRKVLLCKALVSEPDLLILDEPFEGLDRQSVQDWIELLARLNEKTALLLMVNRISDMPAQADHIAVIENCELILQGERTDIEQQSVFRQLQYAERAVNAALPESTAPLILPDAAQNLFELKNVTVKYGDKTILHKLSWTVAAKQNWWIKGPNGAGKSTLLSIITGDHPQGYANHVVLFGRQRGSGETIWDIKKNIGYVSSGLHMDYRVNCSALNVIVSGFFDSVGVYRQVPEALKIKAMQWLERLNLAASANQLFRSLSWGQQRLLLIARAMVKHPPVLILDEPLQGLDSINRKLVKQFIEQLVRNSRTQLLFVSHQAQDAPDCITHVFEFIPQNGGYIYRQSAVGFS